MKSSGRCFRLLFTLILFIILMISMVRSYFAQAGSLFQNIPSEFELTDMQAATHQSYSSLIALFPQLFIDSVGFLVPDSLQFTALNQIAETDYDIPGAWARNILIASGLLTYDEPVFSSSTLQSSRKDKYHWTKSNAIESVFNVFPNPATDYIIVEHKRNYYEDDGLIRILDLNGRILQSQLLKKKEDQQIIPVNSFIPGDYIVQIVLNGTIKASQKLVIIR